MRTVKLTYFRRSGKYYTEGEYNSEKRHMHEIFDEVQLKSEMGTLPGLMKGHSDFIVLIDVPEHPNNHPRLVV